MTTITVRLDKEEDKMFNSYAKVHGIPLSTLMKNSLIEKMEDELVLDLIKEYE